VGVPMRDFADRFGFDASYVTSLADALEEKGWVERRAHPTDRRVKMLAVTEKGRAMQERISSRMMEPPAAVAALSPAARRQLATILKAIVDERSAGSPPAKAEG